MKKKTVCFLIVLVLLGITCLSAQTRSQLQDMYVTFLKSEGFNPTIDSDGDVNFTTQGNNFYINVMENDLQSFQIVLTNFLDVGSTATAKQKALDAASYATRTTRVARAYMTSSGKIAIDAFVFIAKPDDFKLVLNRMVGVILIARKDCLDRM